jgi:hypothetical protein
MNFESPQQELPKDQKERVDILLEGVEGDDLADRYKPTFLGMGGEHMVFAIEDHPNVVAKVDYVKLRRMIQMNHEVGAPLDHIDPSMMSRVREVLDEDVRRSRELRQHFPETTLRERVYLQCIPLNRALAAEAFTDQDPVTAMVPEETTAVATLVRIQRRAPEHAIDDDALSLSFRYQEQQDSVDVQQYNKINAALVDNEGMFDQSSWRTTLSEEGAALIDAAKQSAEAHKALRDFVEKAMHYARETGEGLDLAGSGNVTFFKEDDTWRYLLLDAKYPAPKLIDEARTAFIAWNDGEKLDKRSASILMNSLNMTKLLNGFAATLGIEDRFQLFDTPVAPKAHALFFAIQEQVRRKG